MDTNEERLSSIHSTWADDMDSHGPWEDINSFRKGGKAVGSSIVVVDSCETTMETARQLVDSGILGDWGAVLSAEQTVGRGQLRRPWVSIPGNLHASVVLPDSPAAGEWAEAMPSLLPLVVGYLICAALEGLGVSPDLKWPNDILLNGRKVGGMLIEERNGKSILGFGLNLAGCPSDAEMREDHSAPAGKIAIPSLSGGALTLLETLVSRGKNMYVAMLDEIPPTKFVSMVESRLAWMGRSIRVREGDGASYEAVISGLSSDGGLVLRRGGEESVLYSGSIFPL